MSLKNRIRIRDVRTLSDDWFVLKKTTLDWQRSDGEWQTINRETYDRGNGATLLPYDLSRRTVLLSRQFRYPAYVNGYDRLMIEAAAGLLDGEAPEEAIRREVDEELGLALRDVRQIFACYMSPGSVTERVHFFVGEYDQSMRTGAGGGDSSEGEDLEVLELTIDQAVHMITTGDICDGKTVMLLQHAAVSIFN